MPPLAAAAAAAIGSITLASVLTQIGIAIVGTVISYGISKLANAIGGKPKADNFQFDAENRKVMVRSSIETRKIVYGRCRVSGPLIYAATSNNNGIKNRILHMVVILAGHEVEDIETVYFNDEALTLNGDGYVTAPSKYLKDGNPGYARVVKHLGSDTQPVDPTLASEAPNWTSQHQLKGCAYLYIRLVFNATMFNGVPNVSAIVKGKKVYDPRTATTGYSNNAALCVLDYLRDPVYGFNDFQTTGAFDPFIDMDSFIAGANICDENVTLKDSTTTKRYKVDGLIDSATSRIENLDKLTTAYAGVVTYTGGKFHCNPGAYSSPTITIDEDWLSGDLTVETRTPRSDLFNAVKGVYVDPDKNWQPTTFPLVTNSLYEEQDGNQQIVRDIDLPFTINVEDAQRLGKIVLEKARQGIVVTMPCKLHALQVKPWDTVYVNNAILGWSNKVFRVIQWELNLEGGITLTLQEESSASYDWNAGEATLFDPSPDTNLPTGDIDPPGSPAITETLYSTGNAAGIKTKAIVTWAASESAFVTRYEVQYKAASDTSWISNGQIIETNTDIFDLAAGSYDFRVKAITANGKESEWVQSSALILGLTAPPADVENFAINAINNNAHLSWNEATDLDVLSGGYFHIRWSKAAIPSWSESIALVDVPGSATSATVPLLDGTYLIKAVDSTGNASVIPAMATSTIASVFNMNVVASSVQSPTFAGTKTNMIVSLGNLKLGTATLFDDATGNFDDATGNFDDYGFIGSLTGEYKFDNYLDLGSVYTSRVTASIEALIYNQSTLFDSTSGLFDSASGLFDGDDVTGVDVIWYVRTTQDNPAGSPVWSDWQRFFVGEYTARALEFKIIVTSDDINKNINISELSVSVDVPDRREYFPTQAIAAGGTTFTYTQPFFAEPWPGATISNTVSGDSIKYTHVTSGGKWTGVTIQVLNGGSGVARTGSVMVAGY